MVYAFSDGNPLYEYMVFVLVLLASIAAFTAGPVLRQAGVIIHRIAEFSRQRRALSEHGLTADLRRVDLFRIIVGALATFRYGEMLTIAISGTNVAATALAAGATLVAACVTLGLFTPVSVFVLMSTSNIIFDNYLGASTLGTMVMSICLMTVLLAPGGLTLSIDAVLVNKRAIGKLIRTLRALTGPASEDRILVAKLCGLFAYFCVCLYSVAWHTTDEAWMSGLIISWVMLSPAANPDFFSHMWSFYNFFPWGFVALGKFAIAGMFAWYVLTLPGIFMGRWVRAFTIIWGLLFFLISALVLPLQYLGWYELAFWFLLFAYGRPFGSRSGPELAVLFDDRCNLCDRTVKTLAQMDLFSRLEFRPIRRNIEFANANGVTLEEGLTDLVGVDLTDGSRVSGFDLYYSLTSRMVLLWPMRPILWIARMTGVGPAIYRYIADRRTKLFGVCEFSNIPDRYIRPASLSPHDLAKDTVASPFFAGMVLTLLVLAMAFLVRLPIGTTDPDARPIAGMSKSIFGSSSMAFGINKINVFNAPDLALFRFGSTMYFYPDGVDLTSPSPLDDENDDDLLFNYSDQETYFLTSHMRRMSRMNFGCDREMAKATLPTYATISRTPAGEIPQQDVVLEFRISTWPSAKDLQSYSALEFQTWPLCRYRLNLRDGTVKDFVFVQSGLDEAVRQKGFPPILNAKFAEAATKFPCRYAAAFTYITAGPQPLDERGKKFTDAVLQLPEDAFGRFPSDCFLDTWKIINDRPDLFTGNNITITQENCEIGVEFLRRLQQSVLSDAALTAEIGAGRQRAERAASQTNSTQCLRAAFESWRTYWSAVVRPGYAANQLNTVGAAE
ncbi:thiol-disulfide oxidoreductase DCC family protein [Neorhizobium galegae]|uniref:thiol-disulfide oxidoreductase DCC family protein n=1 Tax=Neorhizobium galegae TaxID=399 RepID=UPI001F43E067|nr:DUF393 domain-containing protein [Neorhizobium galegae]UIK04917.1 DUF393 domain-containing protein [Neorhizobium galegae]